MFGTAQATAVTTKIAAHIAGYARRFWLQV
jgi:cation transport regulator ChaC